MIKCLSYGNIMNDKVTKQDIEVLVHTIMFNCFQSLEIQESGDSFSENFF